MILLNVTLWQRPLIAGWLGTRAFKSASNDDASSALRYIEWLQAMSKAEEDTIVYMGSNPRKR